METVLIYLLVYAYASFCVFRIAAKLGMENPWLAFVPVLNLILLCAMIDRPLWYAVFFFIPLVGFIWGIIVWMRIAEQLGRPALWGAFTILPLVNLLVLFYLAFTDARGGEPDHAFTPNV